MSADVSGPDRACFECGAPATCAHHVIPRSRGGTKTVPLCGGCHGLAHGLSRETWSDHAALTSAAIASMKAAGLYKGQPLADMDLDVIRQRIESVGWVHDVRVVRLLPDTVLIQVVERRQLAVWQSGGQRQVIDVRGAPIPEADPARFASLPLVVGAGADKAAAAILLELSRRPPVLSQVEALVRVDQRRWDLRLRSGGLIQLPAVDEAAALRRLDELDRTSGLMRIGFERLDLRDPAVVAVRPRTVGAVAASPEPPPEGASKG